jgi:hypothetical protein
VVRSTGPGYVEPQAAGYGARIAPRRGESLSAFQRHTDDDEGLFSVSHVAAVLSDSAVFAVGAAFAQDSAPGAATPDRLETSIGTLTMTDGNPDSATA